MVRVTSLLLQIAVTASVANAQLGGFFKNAFGGAIAQVPLVKQDPEIVVAAKSHQLTSENWKSSVNVTIDENASEEDIQEWLLYFTTHPTNGTAQRNVTYWDAVYNDTVVTASKASPKTNFGKIDCFLADSKDLCHSFFLTNNIPTFYHVATYYQNASVEIRRVPMYRNITELNEQPAFMAKFLSEKEWKEITPWTGIFHPFTGAAKDLAPLAGQALVYYEMVPQWVFMIGISLIGRTITSRIIGRNLATLETPAAAPAPAPEK
ncbi:hypothetical protein BZA77DRAFT_386183 [Pyronema omphalodes]|nr:hypothetical protein BZA77DRAFT_386183 [Pyronema omphalodes]